MVKRSGYVLGSAALERTVAVEAEGAVRVAVVRVADPATAVSRSKLGVVSSSLVGNEPRERFVERVGIVQREVDCVIGLRVEAQIGQYRWKERLIPDDLPRTDRAGRAPRLQGAQPLVRVRGLFFRQANPEAVDLAVRHNGGPGADERLIEVRLIVVALDRVPGTVEHVELRGADSRSHRNAHVLFGVIW